MSPCEIVNLVGVITCAIADCVDSDDQIDLLAAVFTQLGDSLATYSAYKGICCDKGNDSDQQPIYQE